MEPRESLAFRVERKKGKTLLMVLDQRLLPFNEHWITCRTIPDMINCINTLAVRGAPLIAIAAAYSLAQFVETQNPTDRQIREAARILLASRPTAVNLQIVMHWMMRGENRLGNKEHLNKEYIIDTAQRFFDYDVRMCDRIAEFGNGLIKDGDRIIHHCNTGGLACAGRGTALGIIKYAHEHGKKILVFVSETRPLLQGARLTAWELRKADIPHYLISDNMVADVVSRGLANKAFVGADRVVFNGDTANKIGTHNLAIICKHFKVPFYVAMPVTTIDLQTQTGKRIEIEQRSASEVGGVVIPGKELQWAPNGTPVYNPAFDVTPAKLITAWVTNQGVIKARGERQISNALTIACEKELSLDSNK